MYQYKITIDERSEIVGKYPDNWSEIVYGCTERGKRCQLQRRAIHDSPDTTWLEGLKDENGKLPYKSMMLGNRFVLDWETLADNSDRVPVVVVL